MNWADFIQGQQEYPYFQQLTQTLQQELNEFTIYPPQELWFNAFDQTPFESTKVVIIGQDPYHQPGQAMGLSFSVPEHTRLPKSLINIFKELADDEHIHNTSGSLLSWAQQGVLLLNTTLTVRQNQPLSHQGIGWEIFTRNAIELLAQNKQDLIFILWGSHARKFEELALKYNHHVIKSPHPSPLSAYRGFFGSKPFSKTNKLLTELNIQPIDWRTD